jgi:hypothetical protein
MLVSINVMKKYISKVSELVKHNTGAFLWILFICGGLMTLRLFISDIINSYIYIEGTTKLFGMDSFTSKQINPSANPGISFLLLLSMLAIALILPALLEGGFLSYLKRGKQEEEGYTRFFFSSGFRILGRMVGATLMQALMILVLVIGGLIIIGIPMAITISSVGITDISILPAYYGYGFALFVLITLVLSAIFALISIIALTMFITFEAALTDETVGEWVSYSFAKAKKVFWSLFLWICVIIIGAVIISSISIINIFFQYGSYFLFIVFTWYMTAFVFYPLYNLATKRWILENIEKEKMDEMDKKILESHYKKLMSEENENPNASGFSE